MTFTDAVSESGLEITDSALNGLMDAEKARMIFGSYLMQGFGAVCSDFAARFVPDADALAESAGCGIMQEVTDRIIPDDLRTARYFLDHPQLALPLARFGNIKAVQTLRRINAFVPRNSKQGRRLGYIMDGALLLSDSFLSFYRRDGCFNPAYIRKRLEESPFTSCLPQGTGLDKKGHGEVTVGRCGYAVAVTKDLRLRFTNRATGKTSAVITDPGRRSVFEPTDTEIGLKHLKHYLSHTRRVIRDILGDMYLAGCTIAAERFLRFLADPLLRPFCEHTVFRQNGADFMVTAKGLVDACGNAYSPGSGNIGIPHPMEMNEGALASFRHMLGRRKPFLPQLREPVFTLADLRAGSTPVGTVHIPDNPGSRPQLYIARTMLPGCAADALCARQMLPQNGRYSRSGMISAEYEEGDKLLNHIVYLLKGAVLRSSIEQDDISVLPILLLDQPKKHLKKALSAGATHITAALLEAVNGSRRPCRPSAEFFL